MNETPNSRPGTSLLRSLLLPVAILIVSIVAWFIIARTQTPVPPVLAPPQPEMKRKQAFHTSRIAPLMLENQDANRQAVERCLARIDDAFTTYRKGIVPFSEDLTSLGTRFHILTRMPLDWWYDDSRIQQYVQSKFEKHIFGERQLNDDLTSALAAFRDELHANRRELLASVKLAVSESDFPEWAFPDDEGFDEQVGQLLIAFASTRAKDAVYHGIATMVTSEVAVYAVTQIITRVATSIGTRAAASAAAAGAAAGGAAAGAGGGSLGGPVGTTIGLGVGFVVGVFVDWWMTADFKATLKRDLHQYLTKLRDGIVEGAGGRPGLRHTLGHVCDDVNHAQRTTIRRALLGESL